MQVLGNLHIMQGRLIKHIIAAALLLHSGLGLATPHYGSIFSYAVIPKEPPDVTGFQLMMFYDPDVFKWRQFNVYFDGGYSHFWNKHPCRNNNINIYSLAPVIHYAFKQRGILFPYLELSIGIAYLNQTRMEKRNLGIHFSFQDRLGIGAFFGAAQRLFMGIHAVHYSNAHLSSHNSGLTVPLEFDIGYRFA
jgi:hypothetical protein